MRCPKCNNVRWIRKEVTLPARIYGAPRKTNIAVPCDHCSQPKYLEPK